MDSIVKREQTKIDETDKKFIGFRPVRLLLSVVEPPFNRKSLLWNAILYRHGANTEDGACPGRQIECEPIGALAVVQIEIIEGSAVEDQLIRGPFPYRSARCVTGEMESRIAVMMCRARLNDSDRFNI